jgi:hypothetical protein
MVIANDFALLFPKKKIKNKIAFLGLIDPVSTGLLNVPTKVPPLVTNLWLAVRDKKQDWKDILRSPPLMKITVQNAKATTEKKKEYSLTHYKMGFSDTVAEDTMAEAKKAGLQFGKLKKP